MQECRGSVGEEVSVAGTEVVHARLTGGRYGEAVAWAFAVAETEELASEALCGETARLHGSEITGAGREHELGYGAAAYVAKTEVGEHEMVAGVEVAARLKGCGVAAACAQTAERRFQADISGECGVEHLHEHAPHIAARPLVAYVALERCLAHQAPPL